MSYIKPSSVVRKIQEGGEKLGKILDELAAMVKPGVTALDLDIYAQKRIEEEGGIPAFKGYRTKKTDTPFPSTICASVNHELVHGIATKEKKLKEGDIISIDIGMQWPAHSGEGKNGNGYFTDTAVTVAVGEVPENIKQLMGVTKKALKIGIEQARPGNTVAAIGRAIEDFVRPHKYGIVEDLVGHGVGYEVHEQPRVSNYYDEELEGWPLKPGVVIAIEPMITLGDFRVKVVDDGWGIAPVDESWCAHYEHTVIIGENGPIIATERPSEKKDT